jgi:hypothetical protein
MRVPTQGSFAEPTQHRRSLPALLSMPALCIARGSDRAACRGRQSLHRGGTARSRRAVVESRVVLRGEALAQHWSDRKRALARSVDVGLDGAGVESNLQALVPWSHERGGDARERHRTWLRRGSAENRAKMQLLMLTRLLPQPNCHGALALSSAHKTMTRASISWMYMRRENVFR